MRNNNCHIVLSSEESKIFRQIVWYPDVCAADQRDHSLKQAEEMQFQMTPTGFRFILDNTEIEN